MSDSPLLPGPQKYSKRSKVDINALVLQAKNGSREAVLILVKHHSNYIYKEARRYVSVSTSIDDLYQAGVEGFLKCFKTYDPSYGVALLTHAGWWIHNEFMKLVQAQYNLVRFATSLDKRKAVTSLRKVMRRGNTVEQAAAILDIPIDIARETLQYLEAGPAVSLDQPMRPNDMAHSGGAARTTLMDALIAPGPEMDDAVDEKRRVRMLRKAMFTLSAREQDILNRTVLTADNEILADIAPDYNVSRERIRQIRDEAIEKLRKYFLRHKLMEKKGCAR